MRTTLIICNLFVENIFAGLNFLLFFSTPHLIVRLLQEYCPEHDLIYGQVQIRIKIVGTRILSNNIFKRVENTRTSLCIFKNMGSKENMLKISWQSRSYQQ